jgi:hypothetical protein
MIKHSIMMIYERIEVKLYAFLNFSDLVQYILFFMQYKGESIVVLCLIKHHTMMCVGSGYRPVTLEAFLTSALDGDGWLVSHPGQFTCVGRSFKLTEYELRWAQELV